MSQQVKMLQDILVKCQDENQRRIIQRELRQYLANLKDLRTQITNNLRIRENQRIAAGGAIARVAGVKVPVQMEPSENYRDEIISQIHAIRAHKNEDKILSELLTPPVQKQEKVKESNRNCGIELEVTGCYRQQLVKIVNDVARNSWNVVHDGTIPSVRNECVHRKGIMVCKYCNQTQNDCKCCGKVYQCPNRNCGCTYSLARLEQYRRQKNNTYLRCCDCKTLIVLANAPCDCVFDTGSPCQEEFSRFSENRRVSCNCPDHWEGGEVVSSPGHDETWLKTAEVLFDAICAQAKENNSVPYAKRGDHATGFHVHVDGAGLTETQQALIVILFNHLVTRTDFQKEHKNVLPSWRLNNFAYAKNNWLGGSDKKQVPLNEVWKQNRGNRYLQVNLSSMNKHGTIEFRVGYLPKNGKEVVAWVKACKEVVDQVTSIPKEEMDSLKTFAEGHEVLTYKPLTEWLEKLDDMPVMSAMFKPYRKFTCHV